MSAGQSQRPTANLTVQKETSRMLTRTHLACVLALALLAAVLTPAGASAASPTFKLSTLIPEKVTPGKPMIMYVSVQDIGNASFSGNVTVSYTFPAGVVPADAENVFFNVPGPTCSTSGQEVKCVTDASGIESGTQFRFQTPTFVEPSSEGILGGGQIVVSGGGTGEVLTRPFSLDAGATAPFAISAFDLGFKDAATFPASQAGANPAQLDTTVGISSEAANNLGFPLPNFLVVAPSESFKRVVTHVPLGFLALPRATALRCSAAQLTSSVELSTIPQCPPESQVGLVQMFNGDIVPLYNVVPPAGVPASFGFSYQGVVNHLNARVRPSDNGVDLVADNVVSTVPLPGIEVSLWGTPADSSHDRLRGLCLQGGFGYNPERCGGPISVEGNGAFLRNPTSCTGAPLPWSIEMDTYQHPGSFVSKEATTPAMEGCESLPFDPSISAVPTGRGAHAPSGLDVELTLPQEFGAESLSQADLRSATVSLPEGVTVNPAAADGLAACSDAELGLGEEGPAQCPDASKIGSIELTTPLLEEPVGGSVFLRSQTSNDPASGEMYRLAIEVRSERYGLAIKLPGSLRVDPATGQLTTEFDDLPQLPFDSTRLHLNSGPRAPLTTPRNCGTYTTRAELISWSGKTVPYESSFTIDGNCAAPGFAPGFQAGTANNTAGEYSPFTLRVTRDAGQPNLSRIDATLPEGLVAKLAGVAVCAEAQAATGACPAASRVGGVIAGIGEGTSPLYLPQAGKAPSSAYLAGPYKGAPYSILTSVPAQAGPFDLGTVLVRSALHVDPATTQVSVTSDPLPQIFGGVPVAYREVRVAVDRPGFTLNPTDCEPQAVRGLISSAEGHSAPVSQRFQVGDCAALAFKPHLSLRLRGKTRRGGHPALTAVLKMPRKGPNANIERAQVSLPGSEFIAQDHLNNVCTRVQYAAGGGGGAGCPKGSAYGRARAFSPLLDRPLEGPVYLRSNGGERELPDLVASLDGQIHVDLVGYVDSNKRTDGLRTTFATVPDAPVSKFVLKMGGGRKSLLENSTNICRGRHRAIVKFDGQNGKVHDFRPLVKAKCGKGARRR